MTVTTIRQGLNSMFYRAWDHVYHEGQKVAGEANSLVDKADTSLLQPAINISRKYYPIVLGYCQRLLDLAVKIMKIAIIGILFFVNTTFFMLGAAAAIVFPEQMRSAVDRISQVWGSLPGKVRFAIFAPFPFAWPSYFIIASPFVGAYVSLYLQDKAGVVRSTALQPQPATVATEPSRPQQSASRSPRRVRHYRTPRQTNRLSQTISHKRFRTNPRQVLFESNAPAVSSTISDERS